VMPYVATKPWRTASTYRKRVVTAESRQGRSRWRVVVDGESDLESAAAGEPAALHRGRVRRGRAGTYSSAVVMATVFQDFGFAKSSELPAACAPTRAGARAARP
jgi:hypothetical protein